jgi:hypothetical protein
VAFLRLWAGISHRDGLGSGCTLCVRAIGVSRECEGTAAKRPSLAGSRAKSALVLGDYGLPHAIIPELERSSPCSLSGGTMP